MSSPLISVILPFLNGGPAFAPALQSILQQTYSHWELLLCDDGSTDGSLELARNLRDPRVTVWSDGKTKGLAARLNECIARAQGPLIARMDADDISYPERFARQVEYLEAHPEIDLVGCPMLVFGEDGEPIGKRPAPLTHEAIIEDPASGFGLAHPTWMARRSWYHRYQYDPNALRFEDAELLYRAFPTSRFANLPQLLYGYRELRGGFRKRLKTRLGRVRYLRARRQESGQPFFYRAALTESIKVVLDGALAVTGTRYLMLRLREEPLTVNESDQWQSLLQHLRQPRIVTSGTLEGAQA
jgi:glycosyltransferase involved in cell wall biosynthesis